MSLIIIQNNWNSFKLSCKMRLSHFLRMTYFQLMTIFAIILSIRSYLKGDTNFFNIKEAHKRVKASIFNKIAKVLNQ